MNQTLIRVTAAIFLCIGWSKVQAEGNLDKSLPLHLHQVTASLDVIIARRVIHFRDSDPSRPLTERIADLRALLKTYFSDHPRESKYSFTFAPYTELNDRMASLASCSPQWDWRTGRSVTSDAGTWLRDHLNDERAYSELIPALESIGYRITIASLESINLCTPRDIEWKNAPRACASSLSPGANLPCGASLTFSLVLTQPPSEKGSVPFSNERVGKGVSGKRGREKGSVPNGTDLRRQPSRNKRLRRTKRQRKATVD